MATEDSVRFQQFAGPTVPPSRARSGAEIKVCVVRAMADQYETFQKVHAQADRLIGLLKSNSRPPPARAEAKSKGTVR